MAEGETGNEGAALCPAASGASKEIQKALPGKWWLQEGQLEPSILVQHNIRGVGILWPALTMSL